MNPVNATSLYVSASRSVLQCDPRDPRALAELCRLLPFFRQSLSCLVCGNLLQDPIAPTDSTCQHYVCRGCRGQRMQLKPSCSWCKDYSRFEENRQLSLLVHCYRKLCLYITQSPLAAHIASAAGDSPDLQAVLTEGLMLAEIEPEPDDADDASDSYAASTSDEAPPTSTALAAVELSGISVNGLHDCNGLPGSDRLQPVAMETRPGELPPCVGGAREAGLCDITGFGEELKHGGGGGSLLLSVEEVLRTLETDSAPPPPAPPRPPHHQSSLNGPRCPSDPPDPSHLTPSLPPENCPRPLLHHPHPHSQPPPPANCPPHTPPSRCHRKRSRSESDSGKLQPLPLASLLPPTTIGANSSPHHHQHQHHQHHHHPPSAAKQDPKFPAVAPPPLPHPHLAPVPNGGPPKVGKTVLVSNKAGLKKTVEHHGGPKKAYTKVRQGAPKPRQQPRDRGVPPHPHPHPLTHPPSPSKPLYKKPVEKKGCKCGRATQNPSVLTCRGQRCPCYSNRKACLDCICRGCQNSYMANGEKKLEAFAVPEKALEQTRLTLGINLTSITAAALRSPATSAPGNALLNVATATGTPVTATFLSGAGHDGRGFDEPLEMRFDC